MPSGNGTGPMGQGPYTGRSQHGEQGFRRASGNRSVGRGFGLGNGRCMSAEQSKESLAKEKEILAERIKIIESKLIK